MCGFVGMNLSYHLDVPSGTTIVLTNAAVFLVVLPFSGRRRSPRPAASPAVVEKPPAHAS